MGQLLDYALPGIPYGCVFALLAIGLVLSYKTSGVLNLAFGAQAYVSALAYYLAISGGWPRLWAFVLAVVVLGPAMGYGLDLLIFRHIRSAPVIVRLTAVLGLLVAIPSAADTIFGNATRLAPPGLFLNQNHVYFRIGSYPLNGLEISTVLVTLAVVGFFGIMFRWTGIGLRMRAVVESPRLAELSGIRSSRVGAFSWAMSSFFAGLAGVLLAPLFANLDSSNFTTLLISAIAAAAFGSFVSIPFALVGGLVLGVGQQILGGYLPPGTVIASGLRPGFPFVVLVVLLLALPKLRGGHQITDPLSGCDPPPPSTASPHVSTATAGTVKASWIAVLVFVVVSCVTWMPANWTDNFTQAMVFSIIFLSITLLTGMGGQISLCQMTFAGVGAFSAGHLASTHIGLPVLVGTLIGGVIAAGLGAIIAIPAIRISGLILALLTLAFALLADNVVFPYSWAGNGATGVDVPRPQIGPISFNSSRTFFVLVLVILVGCAGLVYLVRKGTTGQYLTAIRGSQLAASTIGINVARSKLLVFALAAGLAGIGGGLYGSFQQSVSTNDFVYQWSLLFVVVVMIVGSRTVGGAIQAGFAYVLMAQFLNLSFLPSWFTSLEPVIFGLAALTFVIHPEGVFEHLRKILNLRLEKLVGHIRRSPEPRDSTPRDSTPRESAETAEPAEPAPGIA